jgi:regulation of enolase protein 1 (concanavalin A-like superfamily)
VVTEANSNQYAHAGVMIRDGLSDNSGFADVTLYPNAGGSLFQYRADGGSPTSMAGSGGAPYWVKITRVGNTFTGFASPDGSTWKTLGSTTLTMPSTVYVGLLEASGMYGTLGTATFDNVSTTGTQGVSALPSTWFNRDVGLTSVPGSSSYAGGVFTLTGTGEGAFYVPDGFEFAYQSVSGDCSIVARVASQANSSPFAHAGVIIRDGLSDDSGFAEVTLYPNGAGALFQYRADTGSPNTVTGIGTAPYWVKLTRSGNIFTGAVSANGTTWTTLGSTTLGLSSNVYIGLLQASGAFALGTSTFDNVAVTQ